MKNTFDFLYALFIVVVIIGMIFATMHSCGKRNDCLSKSCEAGKPFYDSETGNCFCAEVPK